MPIPHIPQDLQQGVSVSVETKYGLLKGGRTMNEVPYALPPVRFQDPRPLPDGYRYQDKHYVCETRHCYQPNNNGEGAEDQKGFGNPSEDSLFLNIVTPPSFTDTSKFPVKIYLHGGFLQFGSPHDLNSQAQYLSQERSEVWVNIGYRVSVLGFLACDEPKVDGNFGFKDQWLGLLWVRDNIAAFGGDPANIQLTGLSGGAHSVHQILHHISRLPVGLQSPIRSARLESNAIMTAPKTPAELRPQFEALCLALGLNPESSDILDVLRDSRRVPAETLMQVIQTGAVGTYNKTFRGCLDGSWLPVEPDPMTWQRTGEFAKKLWEKGVRSIILGNVSEEWYLYSISNPINMPADIFPNLLRYYPQPIVESLVPMYPTLPDTATAEECRRVYGDILCDGQVNIPVRLLARDLQRMGFPVLRYEIRWTPEQLRPKGYVTHASDRCLWTVRTPSLTLPQKEKALEWLDAVDREVDLLERKGHSSRPLKQAFTLQRKTIEWSEDTRWDHFMTIAGILPGEQDDRSNSLTVMRSDNEGRRKMARM